MVGIPAKLVSGLLGLSVLLLALSTGLWMYSGGSRCTILGVIFLIFDLRQPLLTVVATLALWMLLHRADVQQWAARFEGAPHIVLAWGMGVATMLVLGGLKIWQHYTLYSCSYDLGVQTSVCWNIANGHGPWDSLQQNNYLGDHFCLIHLLLAPLVKWTQSGLALLLVQCVALGLAVPALYLLCLRHLPQKWLALLFTISLVFNPYFHKVSIFDFHPAALAIPLFMWMMYCIDTDRWAAVLLLAVLVLLVQETVVLPLAGIGLYLALFRPQGRVFGWLLCAVATAWFIAAVTLWIPAFRGGDPNLPAHLNRYANLGGSSVSSIARNLTRPNKIWGLHMLLLSVGYLPLLAPRAALLLLLPILSMSSSGNRYQAAYDFHYSSSILPFMFYAAVCAVASISKHFHESPRLATLGLPVAALLCWNIYLIPRYQYDWSPTHVAALYQLMAEVPPNADVCSTQHLLPHMCTRERACVLGAAVGLWSSAATQLSPDSLMQEMMQRLQHPERHSGPDPLGPNRGREITTFPWIQSDYLLLDSPDQMQHGDAVYPLTPQAYRYQFDEIRSSPDFDLVDEKDGAVLLRRRRGHYSRFHHPPPLITE